MDLQSECKNPCGLKHPIVKLERCDKIWKTLQLIRSMQDKHLEDIQDWIKREPMASEETLSKKPPMTFIPDKTLPLNLIGEPNLPKPYIKYQPTFNNESLPQFQLAEKSRVNLYHCEICSQEYCDYRSFIEHQEEIHGVLIPKKVVAKRDKLQNNRNEDVRSRRNSVECNNAQSNKKLVSDENINLQTIVKNLSSMTDSIKCKLCSKFCKNIKKHMVDYHKIKCFKALSKVTDQNSNFEKVESESLSLTLPRGTEKTLDETKQITSQDTNFSIKNNTNLLKRKISMPSAGLCKRLRSVSSQDNESNVRNKNEQIKCANCGKECINHRALRRHKCKHKYGNKDEQSSEAKRIANKSVNPTASHKTSTEISAKFVQDNDNDKANNNIGHKIPRTRSSVTKEHSGSDTLQNGDVSALAKTEDESLQIKCLCGRLFRTVAILSNHKSGCKFVNDIDTSKSSDTRTGSDRDSGISITIKKKNNSYEIVSKDSGDEEPLRNGHNIAESEICEDSSDSSSDNSDSSEFDDQSESLIPEHSKYSKHHCILKLKFLEEDVTVDVEEDITTENCNTAANHDESRNSPKDEDKVPLLRVLCKRFLVQQGRLPKEATSYKCKPCKIFLGSKERLSKHVDRHKKLMKRSCACGIKFTGIKVFNDHIAEMHPKCIVCPYCKEKYKSIVGLGEHLCIVNQGAPYTETFNENHPCPNCNIAFNNIAWLDSHMKSKHLDPNLPFQCHQCQEKFPNEIARSLHSHKKHRYASACSICNQKFQSGKTKQKHEAYHRGVGFPCHICKKTYRTKRNQLNHIKTVHSDFSNDKIQCFICQKSIKTKSFRKHVLRHNSILACEICNKIVYDFRNLERHIMDYHGNENYPRKKCTICGVSFPTKEQLEAHVIIEKSLRN